MLMRKEIVIPNSWFAGLTPSVALKFSAVGLTVRLGEGSTLTVRFTVTVWGLFVAPVAVTVMVLVYVPKARLALATESVTVASPVPLVGLSVSQAGALASAVTVQLSAPLPPFVIPSRRAAGSVPCTTLKFNAAGLLTKKRLKQIAM